jgi:hypothetical protein
VSKNGTNKCQWQAKLEIFSYFSSRSLEKSEILGEWGIVTGDEISVF